MQITLTNLSATFLLLIAFGVNSPAGAKELPEPNFAQRQKAPPLPQGLTWLNSKGPIELSDLRGKFILVDFWTYCCINCMHILPELNKLEHAYPKDIVVIGVHSAKFNTERDSDNIAEAIARYKIEHPVINDARHIVWDRFGVNSWPTLLLIDPEGYVIWSKSGEVTFEQVDHVMKAAVVYYRKRKLLDETPLKFNAEQKTGPETPLRFPGKVLADGPNGRLFIADSNHNRIIIARLDGTLIDVIGSGQAGMKDGLFASASFKQPQGLALDRDRLFVADTENHAIRRVDLTSRTVVTIAGTGRQLHEAPSFLRHPDPKHAALSSPWDVSVQGSNANSYLYIAMAGCHQIWRMRTDGTTIGPYAGNAIEDIVDGPLLPAQAYELGSASFAQPSGLASDGSWLFVADSEGSSIRAVPLTGPLKGRGRLPNEVRTIVGTAALSTDRLFTFGDVDGPAQQVLFQHPLGLAYGQGRLFVADTYNHKIKTVDPTTGVTVSLAGSGKPGLSDNPPAFREPGGLSFAGGKLYIADTNNHRICVFDLATNRMATLTIAGLKPPIDHDELATDADEVIQKVSPATVRAENNSVRLNVQLRLPEGYHINPLAPQRYQIDAADPAIVGVVDRRSLGKRVRLDKPAASFTVRLPVRQTGGEDTMRVRLEFFYCRDGAEGICKAGTVVWSLPVKLDPTAGNDTVVLHYQAQ